MPVCGSSNLAPGTDPVPGAIQARAWSFQADQKHPISHTSPAHAAQRRPHCPDFCPYYEFISQITEFADVFETYFREKRLNRRNSLHFSLPPGNYGLQDTVKSTRGRPPRSRLSGTGHARKMRIMLASILCAGTSASDRSKAAGVG